MKNQPWRGGRYAILALLFFALIACTLPIALPTPGSPPAVEGFPPTPTPLPKETVTFRVQVPKTEGNIVLAVLNEVTGINIAPQRYPMKPVGDHLYEAQVPAPIGSVLKYRYERHGEDGKVALEALVSGKLVRYRLLRVDGEMLNEDVVARWNDTFYTGQTGRIQGKVTDSTGKPLSDILVTAAGEWAFTLADGSFLLENLPVGEHTLVAYALDGEHRTFQQRAIVGAKATTPATIQMASAPLVTVVFHILAPPDTIAGAPVRLAGNLYTLGNTFADLGGGLSTLANRMPVLHPLGEHQYALKIKLPVGADVRYTYTLGDGYWNAEHAPDGRFVVHQVIVPDHDSEIDDVVATWASGPMRPVWFTVTIPSDTPPGEVVDLQLNPAVWTPPLPMWPLGKNQWGYLLSSPTDAAPELRYRFCRDEQCDTTGEPRSSSTQGGHLFSFAHVPQRLEDNVRWAWWHGKNAPSTPKAQPHPRQNAFWQGVALMPTYHPTWQPYFGRAFVEIRRLHAHWVVLTPTWTATSTDPPVWEPVAGTDPLAADLLQMADIAREDQMNVAIFPQVRLPEKGLSWWQEQHTFPWWVSWFDRYTAFARHFATLAQRSHAGALVLGGNWVAPAVDGVLPTGKAAGAPADLPIRWRGIVAAARQIYHGPIYWALPFDSIEHPPAFLDAVDGIYLLWQPDLGADPSKWQGKTEKLLDEKVKPFASAFHKPVILAVAYPSAKGARGGCAPADKGCLPMQVLFPESAIAHQTPADLERQRAAYAALLAAVDERPWISGVITADYYPAAPLQGPSASVHGKPAADTLGWWFEKWSP